MPIFDVTAPADATKAGLGAKVIREEIKTVFTTKFEAKVVEVIATLWECVKGWPRIYSQAAAPTPPAGAEVGRCWLDTDDDSFWVHDGTVWNRIGPDAIDIRIPLRWGPAVRYTNAGYGGIDTTLLYNAGVWTGKDFGIADGVSFNKANAPAGSTIKFVATGCAQALAQAKVKLYDVAAAADVAGSEVTLAGATLNLAEASSGDLTAAIAAGARKFKVYAMGGTATYYDIAAVELRIVRA